MLDFTLHGFRHRGNILLLVQKMSNDPIQVLAFGAENLHPRKHFDQGLKTLEFHISKNSKIDKGENALPLFSGRALGGVLGKTRTY